MNKNLFQKWFKDLFPICRSITGNGLRQTLSYFEKINPELKRFFSVPFKRHLNLLAKLI